MNKCRRDLEELKTVELGSHQVTSIQVVHSLMFGWLRGLKFFTGDEEIARIGYNKIDMFTATKTIQLQKGEIWCGVSSGRDDGKINALGYITARLE